MRWSRWNPASVGPPIGKYSHLAAVGPGDHVVYIAGQVGSDAEGRLMGPDAATQTRQIFANIATLLGELGVGPDAVVKMLSLVAGTEHLPGYYAARDEVYASWFADGDYPAHSLAVVAALAKPELVVEIEAVVAVPGP